MIKLNSMQSAGILAFKKRKGEILFLLVHPGGPFFAKKELGVYTIPKGLIEQGEDALATAIREFKEETSIDIHGDFLPLGSIVQKGGKVVQAWAVAFDIDPKQIKSNTFPLEWPPRSGKIQQFPEIDKGDWFNLETAGQLINEKQREFLYRLIDQLDK
jgi:predicted NUDIX family NTP pyrophosphohydrolase